MRNKAIYVAIIITLSRFDLKKIGPDGNRGLNQN